MFEYMSASIGPVVEGPENYETIYALDQPQYIPLRTLPGENGHSAISRWELTPEQRKAIVDGADILLEVTHFGGPLAPVRMMILNDRGRVAEDAKDNFKDWFCAQTKGTYAKALAQKTRRGIGMSEPNDNPNMPLEVMKKLLAIQDVAAGLITGAVATNSNPNANQAPITLKGVQDVMDMMKGTPYPNPYMRGGMMSIPNDPASYIHEILGRISYKPGGISEYTQMLGVIVLR